MTGPILLLIAMQAAAPPPSVDTMRREMTARIPCDKPQDQNEITVCGLREADRRYRVPFVEVRSKDIVPAQTARVLEDGMFSCGITGPFLTECGGMVGVTVTIGTDGKVYRRRDPAP
ncbi:hypothetical protein [Sphingomonas sp.]|uniref:hypothetical protein n=1 Tax=Sphingomonas sp. TaxID=28214 RepID=UPI001EBCDC94|nr:hypothetical protein [Sphingomonas sp.]MBX3595873.1 hypothetical protein [Sphingomonas sp.]